MIGLVFRLTVGQLVRQRRTLLLLLLAALPPGLALLYRATGAPEDTASFTVLLLANLLVALVLPLTALVVGTAALGQELEDGTVVYLIAKPQARWKAVAGKVSAAWVVTSTATAMNPCRRRPIGSASRALPYRLHAA